MFKFIWCHALVNNFRYIKKGSPIGPRAFFFFPHADFFIPHAQKSWTAHARSKNARAESDGGHAINKLQNSQ